MKKQILPFDLKASAITWKNYANYLNWLFDDIESIQQYINYFQPSYSTINSIQEKIDLFSLNKTTEGGTEVDFIKLETYPPIGNIESDISKGYYSGEYINTSNHKWHANPIKPTASGQTILNEAGNVVKVTTRPFDNVSNAKGWTRTYYKLTVGDVITVKYKETIVNGVANRFKWDILRACLVNENYEIIQHDQSPEYSGTFYSETYYATQNCYLVTQETMSCEIDSITYTSAKGTAQENYIFEPHRLKWREGVYNSHGVNTYLVLKPITYSTTTDTPPRHIISPIELNRALTNGSLISFPTSFAVFAKKWIHNGSYNINNPELQDKNHYLMIAQSFASLYRIYSLKNNLSFVSNRKSSMIATSFNFSWELSPSRYFISRNDDRIWESGATLWQLYNYDFNPNGGPLINSSKGTSWINNYPLMVFPVSETVLEAGKCELENFIFDYSTTTTESNVDNQTVVVYNISMNNGNGSNTLGWSDFVKIDLI